MADPKMVGPKMVGPKMAGPKMAGPDSSIARRRLMVAGAVGGGLSLLPFLVSRAGAAGSSAAPSSSSSGTFTGNSTDSFNNSQTPGSTGGTTGGSTSASGANGSTSGSQGGGYSATGDSTNVTTAGTGGGSGGSTGATTGGSTVDTVAVTTTTAPPKRPTQADLALLSFAQMIELAVRDLYNDALNAKVFNGQALETVKTIAEAHGAYANSISGLIGRVAPNASLTDLASAMKKDFSGDAKSVATAAKKLEDSVVATHLDIVGQLIGVDGATLIASMLVIEARHATVFSHLAGVSDLDKQLVTEGKALSLSDYPVNS